VKPALVSPPANVQPYQNCRYAPSQTSNPNVLTHLAKRDQQHMVVA
jgi:hypothetical protein